MKCVARRVLSCDKGTDAKSHVAETVKCFNFYGEQQQRQPKCILIALVDVWHKKVKQECCAALNQGLKEAGVEERRGKIALDDALLCEQHTQLMTLHSRKFLFWISC